MEFQTFSFSHLKVEQLYEIYKLRSKVFVVEQNCAYQDIDEKDPASIHCLLTYNKQLAGYCRILPPGLSYKECAIGRVVVDMDYRSRGYGKLLMRESIDKTIQLYGRRDIVLSAQTYLKRFYTDLGFKEEGDGYLEDDIPHIKMRLTFAAVK